MDVSLTEPFLTRNAREFCRSFQSNVRTQCRNVCNTSSSDFDIVTDVTSFLIGDGDKLRWVVVYILFATIDIVCFFFLND